MPRLEVFLLILCGTPPWDQLQKDQGNGIVICYLPFTGLLGYQPSHCYQSIFLELLLQLLLLLLTTATVLYTVLLQYCTYYRLYLSVCIYCTFIPFTPTIYAFTAYTYILHNLTVYMLVHFTGYFTVTGSLYFLQTLAVCMPLLHILCIYVIIKEECNLCLLLTLYTFYRHQLSGCIYWPFLKDSFRYYASMTIMTIFPQLLGNLLRLYGHEH